MKRSDRWFSEKAVQDTRTNVATLPVLARVGPDNPSEPTSDRNEQNERYFEVGKSKVGEEEVIG